MLFYGSCLRGGDPFDGLVDLYLVVDDYRCVNQGRSRALWNRLLPPNVFYTEVPIDGRTLRCKYAVISAAQLRKACSRRWYHSYFWGRFSQPTAIAWARDDATHARTRDSLALAIHTFLERTLPCVKVQGDIESLWREALRLSYGAELRPESDARASELARSGREWYLAVTRLVQPALSLPLEVDTQGYYRLQVSANRRRRCRAAWALRTAQGKLLSVARLLKALFTFDGALDYAAWKLERHSGQRIEVPARVRRYPLIFIWGLFWDLYRRGIFR